MNSNASLISSQNPQGYEVQCRLLQEFEGGLDPLNPQANPIPCHVLGYGEISTVFGIDTEGLHDLAFKRMCIFKTQEEAQVYLDHYLEYNRRLEREIGLNLPPYGYALLMCDAGRPVFYIIQKRLLPASIGNQAIYWLSPQEITLLVNLALQELLKVWRYNQSHPDAKVGIDGQISNWAISGFDPRHPQPGRDGSPVLPGYQLTHIPSGWRRTIGPGAVLTLRAALPGVDPAPAIYQRRDDPLLRSAQGDHRFNRQFLQGAAT